MEEYFGNNKVTFKFTNEFLDHRNLLIGKPPKGSNMLYPTGTNDRVLLSGLKIAGGPAGRSISSSGAGSGNGK